ncbi:hypothetical protein L083_7239 [Actinoplanes sp. N902-109]|nr:hypothetical protein L083_7239 [Actinoplanes sp. N902-109]
MTGAVLALVIPAHAWAASKGVDQVALEAARYRRRRSGFGFFPIAGICCLVVVGAIILAVVLISRNRKRR